MDTAPWDQTFERTVRAALPYLEPDEPLLPVTSLPDCGLDSMGMIQLTEVLERTYGVSFPPGTMPTTAFSCAGTLWGAVQAARVVQQLDAGDGSGGRRATSSAAARAGHLAQPWLP
ncbi:acyl carrier protein [Streptacidiphilus melanogenes]|uniref:acyl carrier protein n=1 Tax=Streptacidiphilus melanogenes TaxID=411235 RepID=UPI0005A7C473|nr:acyl carrier protein [Streptacidiphilus melanogenes]